MHVRIVSPILPFQSTVFSELLDCPVFFLLIPSSKKADSALKRNIKDFSALGAAMKKKEPDVEAE